MPHAEQENVLRGAAVPYSVHISHAQPKKQAEKAK